MAGSQQESTPSDQVDCRRAASIRVSGIVQGVGFRPFVWQLAQRLQLCGKVWNDAEGVVIQVWGEGGAIDEFLNCLQTLPPPLAQVDEVNVSPLETLQAPDDFQIVESQTGFVLTHISPDAAICPECLAEINDPQDRRYRYPFTNCTHCGPRLSIIRAIPYDRDNTSMHAFEMCPECQREYDDPNDRRFHAQPNACKTCGPEVWLENNNGDRISDNSFIDDLEYAAALIKQGYIIAIKGIGGFHLACDATNHQAVNELRKRKHRYHKPLALMARDLTVIRQYAKMTPEEERLLQDSAAPVVLLDTKNNNLLSPEIALEQNQLGFILPYTPLHALLLQQFSTPIVMTSGNLSDEAQCIDNEQAKNQLVRIADFFLLHNRDIVNRVDDSVVRAVAGSAQILRRGRGYAPRPVQLPSGFIPSPEILAMGAELKNTFCLVKNDKAILSQYQGDLEDSSVFQDYQHNLQLYKNLYKHQPAYIAIDQHPEYISSKWGQQVAADENIELIKVQHHHAHVAACMAEHGLPLDCNKVLGIALDGLGYGDNAELWGGEFLLADYSRYQRVATFQSVAMPGGIRAILEPWRNTIAHIHNAMGWETFEKRYAHLPFVQSIQEKPVKNLLTMINKGINSPLASSAGRLFDAVAAVLGINWEQISYEGQAAITLEAMAAEVNDETLAYPYEFIKKVDCGPVIISWSRFWQSLLEDLTLGVSAAVCARRFHNMLIHLINDLVVHLADKYDFHHVILTGGVFQNKFLTEGVLALLNEQHPRALIAKNVVSNDGGIALGQAVIAAARIKDGTLDSSS